MVSGKETQKMISEQIADLRLEMEEDPDVIDDPNGDKAQEYGEDLNNLEEDLENAESVYDIIPLRTTTMVCMNLSMTGAEYAVGDDEQQMRQHSKELKV